MRGVRAGFTLIELIVTLLILAVMSAVAAPAFLADPEPAPLEEAQGRIEALFRLARDSAVRSARPVSVVLDSASSLVWIDTYDPVDEVVDLPEGGGPPRGFGAGVGDDLVQPDGSIRLRAGGTFGGGSSLGMGIGAGSGAFAPPADGESLGLPAGVTLHVFQARSRFTFAPDGSVLGDSLVLRSAQGQARTISLDRWSGHVHRP